MKNYNSLGSKQYYSRVMSFCDCTYLDCGFKRMNPKQWCFGGTDSMREWGLKEPVSCTWPVRFRWGLSTSKEGESPALTTPFAFALKHIHFFGALLKWFRRPDSFYHSSAFIGPISLPLPIICYSNMQEEKEINFISGTYMSKSE